MWSHPISNLTVIQRIAVNDSLATLAALSAEVTGKALTVLVSCEAHTSSAPLAPPTDGIMGVRLNRELKRKAHPINLVGPLTECGNRPLRWFRQPQSWEIQLSQGYCRKSEG